MDLDSLDDGDLATLADRIGPHLDPGQYGDRVVLTRRQLIGAATGTLSAGALMALGVDPATAQAAGQMGTESEPVAVEAASLSGADILNANSGTVPAAQGDGTLAMEAKSTGGDLQWEEDGNSPQSFSSADYIEISLADTGYDSYYIAIHDLGSNGNDGDWYLRFSGDSGSNYEYIDETGAETSGANSIVLVADDRRRISGTFLVNEMSYNTTVHSRVSGVSVFSTPTAYGVWSDTDVSSITIGNTGAGSSDLYGDIEVYHRNIS